MSREFPDFVDPWKAADGRRAFRGTMPLRRMQRLLPLLAEARAESDLVAAFQVHFGRDRQGLVTLHLRVQADLPLQCQRSLESYLEHVDRASVLAVVQSVAEQEQVPEHYDPVLAEQGRIALLDVVEDELLLAVPQVPRSPETTAVDLSTGDDAPAVEKAEAEDRHRPFAGLAALLDRPGKD